jgi:hypothetical protein
MAGIPYSSLDVDGRSMMNNLLTGSFTGWRKRMLLPAPLMLDLG